MRNTNPALSTVVEPVGWRLSRNSNDLAGVAALPKRVNAPAEASVGHVPPLVDGALQELRCRWSGWRDVNIPAVTLASYNMRKAVGTDRRRDPDRVLAVLKEIDADIVALQEADHRVGRRASAVPHELIDSHGHYQRGPAGRAQSPDVRPDARFGDRVDELLKVDTRNLGWHGNAILVKPHIEVMDVAALELADARAARRGPRRTLIGDLPTAGHRHPSRPFGPVAAAADARDRRRHRRAARNRMPSVLMGDTNEWRRAAGCLRDLRRISDRADRPQLPRPPARSRRSTGSSSTAARESKRRRAPQRGARRPSDHLPVWARIAGSGGSPARLNGLLFSRLADLALPPALDRRTDAHRLAIFGHRAPGDVEALAP